MKRQANDPDPAVLALNRVLAAGDDDEEYNAAIAKLEACTATTIQGVEGEAQPASGAAEDVERRRRAYARRERDDAEA